MDIPFLHRPHARPHIASTTLPALRRHLTIAVYRRLPTWAQDLAVRLAAPRHSIGVCAVVCDPAGRILLVRPPYGALERWGLPGGFVEAGEDPQDALEREVREELGVVATVGTPLTATSHLGRRHVTLYYEAAVGGAPEVDGVEVEGWRYVPVAEVPLLLGEEARVWLPAAVVRHAA